MKRYTEILTEIQDSIEAAQKTYQGKKRSELKDSDFLFPETRSFPIVSPVDIPDAISNFGRMKGPMSYDTFLAKLYKMAKRKGPEFVAALPKATKDKLGIKDIKACDMMENYEEDETEDETEENDPIEMEIEKLEKELELEMLKQKLMEIKKSKGQDFTQVDMMEKESVEQEMMEYKNDFFEMSVGSIKSIMTHAQNIINALEQPSVKENLTESWLQGKIAVTEDYMITIHNFVMFGPSETDTEAAENRPGLWENIRKKRQKMGKDYRPAKPGDKDRPDSNQWKNLTKDK
jgi:hypothetical protein